ncbi:MAG TPA: hypothetical protein VK686_16075 [Bryobacteraceae bacterium]|jgi:hypothetical protein|nr:hypothetical protein [Bryobacteraceae bacterium]
MLYRLIPFVIAGAAFAQAPAQPSNQHGPTRTPLFFREEWKIAPGAKEHGVTQDEIGSANLELKLYGESGKEIQATGSPTDPNNPPHVWTGLCTSPCAIALRDKTASVDLSGGAKIRWVTKVSGLHQVHPIVKLADGTWLVGDHADGSTADWHENEFSISEVRWLKLDVDKVVTKGNWVEHPDLTKVDEVGFTDLLPGSGHGPGGWSDVAAFEVYGKPVKRDGAATTSSK